MAKATKSSSIIVREEPTSTPGEMGACFPGDDGPRGDRGPKGDDGTTTPSSIIFLETVDDLDLRVGDSVNYSFPRYIGGRPPITESVTGLPSNVLFRSNNVSGIVRIGGDFIVTHTVTDASGVSINQMSTIFVRSPVVLSSVDLLFRVGREEVEQLPRGELGSEQFNQYVYMLTGFPDEFEFVAARRIIQGTPLTIFGSNLNYSVSDPAGRGLDSTAVKLCIITMPSDIPETLINTRKTTSVIPVTGLAVPLPFGKGTLVPIVSDAGTFSINAPELVDIGAFCGYYTGMILEWKYAKDFVSATIDGSISSLPENNTDLQEFFNLMYDNTESKITATLRQDMSQMDSTVVFKRPPKVMLPTTPDVNLKINEVTSSPAFTEATGGTEEYDYSVDPLPHLSFDGTERMLKDPMRIYGGPLTYTARDKNINESDSKEFILCVTSDPISFRDAIGFTSKTSTQLGSTFVGRNAQSYATASRRGSVLVRAQLDIDGNEGTYQFVAPGLADISEHCGLTSIGDFEWYIGSGTGEARLTCTGFQQGNSVTNTDIKDFYDYFDENARRSDVRATLRLVDNDNLPTPTVTLKRPTTSPYPIISRTVASFPSTVTFTFTPTYVGTRFIRYDRFGYGITSVRGGYQPLTHTVSDITPNPQNVFRLTFTPPATPQQGARFTVLIDNRLTDRGMPPEFRGDGNFEASFVYTITDSRGYQLSTTFNLIVPRFP